MSLFTGHIRQWSMVYVKGGLWVLIAMGTHWIDKTQDLVDPVKFQATSWYFWVITGLATILQGFISLRTFLDQTVARQEATLNDSTPNETKPNPPKPAPGNTPTP